jgi:hypothetical protein
LQLISVHCGGIFPLKQTNFATPDEVASGLRNYKYCTRHPTGIA